MLSPFICRRSTFNFSVALTLLIGWGAGIEMPKGAAQDDAAEVKYEELPYTDAFNDVGKKPAELVAVKTALAAAKKKVDVSLSPDGVFNAQDVNDFFNGYIFPMMTDVRKIESPESFNHLYTWRQRTLKILASAREQSHAHLVKLVLAEMTKVAQGNFHPAARYNAVLIIGMLNAKEAVLIASPSAPAGPPEPMPEALPVLVDELVNAKQIDSVRVAALLGILRHVQWDARQPKNKRIADDLRQKINNAALAIVNAKEPPPGRTVEGHAWLQRKSFSVLSAIGTLGTDVNLALTMDSMIGDEAAPLWLRCSAAEAMGQINLPKETKLKPSETAKKMGELAIKLCETECDRAEAELARLTNESKQGADGGPGMMMPMPGAAGKKKSSNKQKHDPYKLTISQRTLKYQLHSIAIGLNGIKEASPPPTTPPRPIATRSTDDAGDKPAVAAAPPADNAVPIVDSSGMVSLAKAIEQNKALFVEKLADNVIAIRDTIDEPKITDLDTLITETRKKLRDLVATLKVVGAGDKAAAPEEPGDEPAAAPPVAKAGVNPADPPADAPVGDEPPAAAAPAAEKPKAPAAAGEDELP